MSDGFFASMRQSGWECAMVLAEEFRDRLTLPQLILAEKISKRAPERLSIGDAGSMLLLHAQTVARRV